MPFSPLFRYKFSHPFIVFLVVHYDFIIVGCGDFEKKKTMSLQERRTSWSHMDLSFSNPVWILMWFIIPRVIQSQDLVNIFFCETWSLNYNYSSNKFLLLVFFKLLMGFYFNFVKKKFQMKRACLQCRATLKRFRRRWPIKKTDVYTHRF